MILRPKKKRKLVLSGSAMKYPAFVGAIKRLEEEGIDIVAIGGSSGGGLIAHAYASGYTTYNPYSLEQLVLDTLPGENDLLDYSWWPFSAPWGLIKGKKMLKLFRQVFERNFHRMKIPLFLTTTNLQLDKTAIWEAKTAFGYDAALITRTTIALPGVLAPVKIDGEYHADGGIRDNFRIDHWGHSKDVIGLRIIGKDANAVRPIKSVSDFGGAVVSSMMRAIEEKHIEDAKYARIMNIRTSIDGMNFNLTPKEALVGIQEGYECVDKYIREGFEL